MDVLVACEFSGTVRDAFLDRGHNAYSCDLLPDMYASDRHYQGDVRDILDNGWDLMIGHPPCTRLCNSGVRWLTSPPKQLQAGHYSKMEQDYFEQCSPDERLAFMWDQLIAGAGLFSDLWNAEKIKHVAIENPIMHHYAKEMILNYEKQAQVTQPWHHGEPAFKGTALWIRGCLQPLTDTNRLVRPAVGTDEHKKWSAIHRASPGIDRWKLRSTFFQGIADAMAEQWGQQVQQHMETA